MMVIECPIDIGGVCILWLLDVLTSIDKKKRLRTKLYDKTADLNFPIGTLHLYVTIFLLHLHLEYTY